MVPFVPLWSKFLIVIWFVLQIPVIVSMLCQTGTKDFFGDNKLYGIVMFIYVVLGIFDIYYYIELFKTNRSKEEDGS